MIIVRWWWFVIIIILLFMFMMIVIQRRSRRRRVLSLLMVAVRLSSTIITVSWFLFWLWWLCLWEEEQRRRQLQGSSNSVHDHVVLVGHVEIDLHCLKWLRLKSIHRRCSCSMNVVVVGFVRRSRSIIFLSSSSLRGCFLIMMMMMMMTMLLRIRLGVGLDHRHDNHKSRYLETSGQVRLVGRMNQSINQWINQWMDQKGMSFFVVPFVASQRLTLCWRLERFVFGFDCHDWWWALG